MRDLQALLLSIYGGQELHEYGYCWHDDSVSMVAHNQMEMLIPMITDIIENDIEGDVIEAGVWKGGACIFMREILNNLGSDKTVFVADSFHGVPAPDVSQYPVDEGDYHHTLDYLSVSQDQVESNFRRLSSLDNVKFINGWFKDTLHKLDAKFSLIRLDGDLYESTMDSMKALYPKLSVGGYCLIDDWGGTVTAGPAVRDYMATLGAQWMGNDICWMYNDGRTDEATLTGPQLSWKKS